jgi:hypothetical protein
MHDDALLDAIGAHVERHLGPLTTVVHDRAHPVPITLLHVAPGVGRPFHAFITAGMSRRGMSVPDGAEAFGHAELVLTLPPESAVGPGELRDSWPVWWLKRLARFPHDHATWLGWGHTVPNGDPPEPIAPGTHQCCLLLVDPTVAPKRFAQLETDERLIHFYSVVPVYREEMELRLRDGVGALVDRIEAADVRVTWRLDRPRVTGRPRS